MDRNSNYLPFRRVAVFGAGTMGAQIAAHLANAGVDVLLLDLASSNDNDPKALVKKRLMAVSKLKPNPFFTKASLDRIQCGTIENDIGKISEVEWIIEAVIEHLDIKLGLLDQIERNASVDSIISTNTSGIPIRTLAQGRSKDFTKRFLGTHFFNPPRYLRLLEVITHEDTDPDILNKIEWYARVHLGKEIVMSNDVPYFISNRIGMYGMVGAIQQYVEGAYSIEEIDTLTGPLVGRPKSATFRTADLVGLDVMQLVTENLYESVPHDESRERFKVPDLVRQLVNQGALGAKSGAGFYRKQGREIQSLNLLSMQYESPQDLNLGDLKQIKSAGTLPHRLSALYQDTGRAGAFFRNTMLDLMAYAARRIDEITDNPASIDRALCLGFGWQMGPFETWDTIGFNSVRQAMMNQGLNLPNWVKDMPSHASFYSGTPVQVYIPSKKDYVIQEVPDSIQSLKLIKLASDGDLWANEESGLVDMGDGVVLFEFRSKACTLSSKVMDGLVDVIDRVEHSPDLRGLIIGNEGNHFSVGANLAEIIGAVKEGDFKLIDQYIARFQAIMQRVHYAKKPVVVAAHQRVLGGGCELMMASPNVVAAAETYAGLVELGVGLIPAGTGTTRLVAKASKENIGYESNLLLGVMRYFEMVAKATVSTSAEEARELGYLPSHACIVMNSASRFYAAKHEVMRLSAQGYRPPVAEKIRVLGQPGGAALNTAVYQLHQGRFISDYDLHLAKKLAYVFTGGDLSGVADVSESYLIDLEREVFLSLLGQPKTQERIAGILQYNRPVRN
ncbi:MAG: 3-hydroxyacyl-CoA dehydrogenase NAD-binding domain-containing protein [Bacteroidetes bacterium]|nr:3-hydroxyacyl-CoA dehydrogenase NAD-binding domain-containing protein [Bacteroidota bacterium]